jgi:hypothetical protein
LQCGVDFAVQNDAGLRLRQSTERQTKRGD